MKKQIEVRFPETGTKNKLRCFAKFHAPQYRGIHLVAIGKLDIKREVNRPNDNVDDDDVNEGFIEDDTDDTPPLYPTSQLRKQMSRNQNVYRGSE